MLASLISRRAPSRFSRKSPSSSHSFWWYCSAICTYDVIFVGYRLPSVGNQFCHSLTLLLCSHELRRRKTWMIKSPSVAHFNARKLPPFNGKKKLNLSKLALNLSQFLHDVPVCWISFNLFLAWVESSSYETLRQMHQEGTAVSAILVLISKSFDGERKPDPNITFPELWNSHADCSNCTCIQWWWQNPCLSFEIWWTDSLRLGELRRENEKW